MLAPLQNNPARRRTAVVKFQPPPIDGWNARDDLSNMKPTEAVVLDNLIPTEGGVELRKGRTSFATSLGSSVDTLMAYNPPDGSDEFYAAAGSDIYDITTGTASSSVNSLTNARFQHVMFSNTSNNYLVACNGADDVLNYNGTSWSTPTITGVTSANLINVASHMSRLWFVEDDTLSIWYLGTNAISGAATKIDLAPLSKLGGQLLAMASWTRDGGAGMDDLAVFLTSKGEAHVYQGTDPDSADAWSRVGTFKIPKPIGHRCVTKVGADVAVITEQGVLPLSAILPLAGSVQAKTAATERITSAFADAASNGSSLNGWQVLEYDSGQLLIVNVPLVAAAQTVQFVMNSVTQRWCRFTGFDAACWGEFAGDVYWGSFDGTVHKYTGNDDNGDDIVGKCVSAFNNFGTPLTKTFKRARAQFFGAAGYVPRVGLRLDYGENEITFLSEGDTSSLGAIWDEATWDVDAWAPGAVANAVWKGIVGEGFTAAFVVQITANDVITYNGAKIAFEIGDAL